MIVLAKYDTRCHCCRAWLPKGEPIDFYEGHPVHPECLPSYGPW